MATIWKKAGDAGWNDDNVNVDPHLARRRNCLTAPAAQFNASVFRGNVHPISTVSTLARVWTLHWRVTKGGIMCPFSEKCSGWDSLLWIWQNASELVFYIDHHEVLFLIALLLTGHWFKYPCGHVVSWSLMFSAVRSRMDFRKTCHILAWLVAGLVD